MGNGTRRWLTVPPVPPFAASTTRRTGERDGWVLRATS